MTSDSIEQQSRPRMKRSVEQIPLPEGELVLMPACGEHVRVREIGPVDLELLGSLDGSATLADLSGRFGAQRVRQVVAEMGSLGLIEDARDDDLLAVDVRERFDRQVRYFAEVAAPDGPTPSECQTRLASAKVAVLGTGGLGGRAAIDLASIGVGELWLADGDRVETSNLARQIQYGESDLGLLKAERLAARIASLNSATTIRTATEMLVDEEEIAGFVAGADLLVDAADWPPHEIERRCNAVCFGRGIPYIAMSHFPPIARIGPLYVPGVTGCHACQEATWRREYPLYDAAAEQRARRPIPSPTLGPACGLTAGWVATEVMHFLTRVTEPVTLGAGYTLDLRTAELRRHDVPAEPDCPICAPAPGKKTRAVGSPA